MIDTYKLLNSFYNILITKRSSIIVARQVVQQIFICCALPDTSIPLKCIRTGGLKRVPSVVQLLFKGGLRLSVQLLTCFAENSANVVQFFTFCTLPGTANAKAIPSLADILAFKPLPIVANCLKNPPSVTLELANMVPSLSLACTLTPVMHDSDPCHGDSYSRFIKKSDSNSDSVSSEFHSIFIFLIRILIPAKKKQNHFRIRFRFRNWNRASVASIGYTHTAVDGNAQ